jgi:hypothetical protein
MQARGDSEAGESGGRRTRKNTLPHRIGMIYTILRDRIITKSTSTAMKRFERSPTGRTDCTRIAGPGMPLVMSIAMKMTTDLG